METLTLRSGRGDWKSAVKRNSLVAYSAPVRFCEGLGPVMSPSYSTGYRSYSLHVPLPREARKIAENPRLSKAKLDPQFGKPMVKWGKIEAKKRRAKTNPQPPLLKAKLAP